MDPKCLLTSTDLQTRQAPCQHQLSFLFHPVHLASSSVSFSDGSFNVIVPVRQRFLTSGGRWLRPWNSAFRCRSDGVDDLAVQLVDVVVCDINCVDLVGDATAKQFQSVSPVFHFGSKMLSFRVCVDCYNDRDVVESHHVVARCPSALRRQLIWRQRDVDVRHWSVISSSTCRLISSKWARGCRQRGCESFDVVQCRSNAQLTLGKTSS